MVVIRTEFNTSSMDITPPLFFITLVDVDDRKMKNLKPNISVNSFED